MSYSKSQLKAIMDKPGHAYVPRDKIPYAGRVAETLVRKKTYALEDSAALAGYDMLKVANQDIRNYGLQLADRYNLNLLGVDRATLEWRKAFLAYVNTRLNQAVDALAEDAYKNAITAYAGGYYGRLWVMDSIVKGRYTVYKPRLQSRVVSQAVLHPGLTESIQPDYYVYATDGHEWQDSYRATLPPSLLKIRKATNAVIVGRTSVRDVLNAVSAEIGIGSDKPRGLYFATQSLTRTNIMRASNHGAVAAYQAQTLSAIQESTDGWILGLVFTTAGDDRVCYICSRHEGELYVLNDLFGILLFGLPPDSTHTGCRCGFVPLLLPDLRDGNNDPPKDTWDEWADDNDFTSDIDWFVTNKRLKSTQI